MRRLPTTQNDSVPATHHVDWSRSIRLVPSRFPTISLFERIAEPEDIEVVFAIEMMANPRLRDEVGDIQLVPPEGRVSGHGSTPVMAAFCHLNPAGSRFSDGTWGVYYAASTLETAVTEVAHHRAIFLAATNEDAIEIDLRAYVGRVDAALHDVRVGWDTIHDLDSYGASQALARRLRAAGSVGLVNRSVRHAGGECVALFRPKAIRLPVLQGAHVTLHWNGMAVDSWYEKSALKRL